MTPDIERWWDESPRAALLLLAGATLGPHGLRVLDEGRLDLLAPAMPVALAAIGVLLTCERRWRTMIVQAGAIGMAALVAVMLGRDTAAFDLAGFGQRVLMACVTAALAGPAGVLLLSPACSSSERRVLGLGLLLVIGGSADSLGALALPAGAVAAAIWIRIAPATAQAMRPDIAYVARAFVALLMVMAGARLELSAATLVIAGVYAAIVLVLARLTGPARLVPATVALALAEDLRRTAAPGVTTLASGLALVVALAQLWDASRRVEHRPLDGERVHA